MKDFHITLVGPKAPSTLSVPRQPLGVGYLAAVLEKDKFPVSIFDPNVQEINCKVLLQDNPDIIGFSCITRSFEWTVNLVKTVRLGGFSGFVLMGGPHITLSGSEILQIYPFVDGIVRGEGEITLLELSRALYDETPLQNVHGLSFRNPEMGSSIQSNPPRSLLESLDELPFAARHLMPELKHYDFLATILSSRGCPYNCAFCTVNRIFSEKGTREWRARSPENIIQELELLERSDARRVYFVDDNFLVDMKRILCLIDLIREHGISLSFSAACRADQLIKFKNHLHNLRSVGFSAVEIGIENGCQGVLDRYNKEITVQQNEEALHLLHKNRIKANIDFILFDAETTLKELEENLDFLRRNNLEYHDEIFVNSLYLEIGSEIHKRYMKKGWIKEKKHGLNYSFHHAGVARIYQILRDFEFGEGRKIRLYIHKIWEDLMLLAEIADIMQGKTREYFVTHYHDSMWTLKHLPFSLFERCLDSISMGSEPCESELCAYVRSVFEQQKEVLETLHEKLEFCSRTGCDQT